MRPEVRRMRLKHGLVGRAFRAPVWLPYSCLITASIYALYLFRLIANTCACKCRESQNFNPVTMEKTVKPANVLFDQCNFLANRYFTHNLRCTKLCWSLIMFRSTFVFVNMMVIIECCVSLRDFYTKTG